MIIIWMPHRVCFVEYAYGCETYVFILLIRLTLNSNLKWQPKSFFKRIESGKIHLFTVSLLYLQNIFNALKF